MIDRYRPHVLLTGFQPFPNNPINATQALVPEFARLARHAFPDIRVETEILPTEWRFAPTRIEHLLLEREPDIALSFGISGKARRFTVETRGQNWRRESMDAAGVEMKMGRLMKTGPDYIPARLPVANIAGRLRRRHIPVTLSRNAGGYLCNALLYHGLHRAPQVRGLKHFGFIHVPADLPVPGMRRTGATDTCPVSWHEILVGSLEVLGACLGRTVPIPARTMTGRRHA